MTQRRKKKFDTRATVALAPLLPRSVNITPDLAKALSDTRRRVRQLYRVLESFDGVLMDLENEDKMGNFQIQDLMGRYNRAEQLASAIQKKKDDTANCIIKNIA